MYLEWSVHQLDNEAYLDIKKSEVNLFIFQKVALTAFLLFLSRSWPHGGFLSIFKKQILIPTNFWSQHFILATFALFPVYVFCHSFTE